MTILSGVSGSKLTRLADNGFFQEIALHVEHFMARYEEPREFVPGKTRIPLNVPTYGAPEVIEALDSLMSTWVTMGAKVKAFEEMWADYIGVQHAVMTNSGSSANLLALSCLGLEPGDEVIVPALTWSTSIFPIAQAGGVPVLVDVERETYNISPKAIERAITPRTKAIMAVHLLGNPCEMNALIHIAGRHGLYLVEDACEAHGAEYHGEKVGSWGDIATFSFFFSHHISTIEGGMVLPVRPEWADACRSLRAHGWVREMAMKEAIARESPTIDPRFLFATVGYNMRPTEIAGAFGIHQLPRLEGLVEHRRSLAAYFNEALERYSDWLMLPSEAPNTRHSYFAYALTVREGAPFTKQELVAFLEAKGLETRPIEGSNMAIQPAMQHIKFRAEDLTNTEYIHEHSFFFGLHQGIAEAESEAIVGYFEEFMEDKS